MILGDVIKKGFGIRNHARTNHTAQCPH